MEYSKFDKLLHARGITVYQVAKATGIAPSTFADWKSGRSTPKADKLSRIAEFFGLGLDEFLGTDVGVRSLEISYRAARSRRMVPVVGVIRAGAPIVTDETLLDREFADVDDADDYFYLEICGDSMKNCGIVCGSRVLFRKQQYAENGSVVACFADDDCAIVRRFSYDRKSRRIILSPENDAFSPVVLSPVDFETGRARILGVAVEVKTKL